MDHYKFQQVEWEVAEPNLNNKQAYLHKQNRDHLFDEGQEVKHG
jgi:hypothetical protein